MTDRRRLLGGLGIAGVAAALAQRSLAAPFAPMLGPRSRMVFVNDLSGDLDGLFAAVHAVLSPSLDLRAIIGTATGRAGETAAQSAALASEIAALTRRKVPVIAGSERKLAAADQPAPSPGADAIIAEAMRDDSKLPLYVAVGGGLTEVASALMREPRIAGRMTLVWIGGDAWPGGGTGETNFNIDPIAAMHAFNQTQLRIWQIPRAAYATCLISATEIQAQVAPCGKIGAWLYGKIVDAPKRWQGRLNFGETWTLGDNPLIAVTALSDWGPSAYRPNFVYERTGSSLYTEGPLPTLNADGTFTANPEGRMARVYTTIDNRMMMADLFAKLKVNAA